MELEVLEKIETNNTLSVTVEIKLRKFCSMKKVVIRDKNVKNLLAEEYDILSVIKSNSISNSMRGGHKQVGNWVFRIKPKTKPKPRNTKTSTKSSIRGRMSNIAKKIEKDRNEREE